MTEETKKTAPSVAAAGEKDAVLHSKRSSKGKEEKDPNPPVAEPREESSTDSRRERLDRE